MEEQRVLDYPRQKMLRALKDGRTRKGVYVKDDPGLDLWTGPGGPALPREWQRQGSADLAKEQADGSQGAVRP